MEGQAPLNLPYGPCSECDILFPSQLHILSVGRDTELQLQPDDSLNCIPGSLCSVGVLIFHAFPVVPVLD